MAMASTEPLALLLLVALSTTMAMPAAGEGSCNGHKGAAVAEFHMDHEGGAYYEVSTNQASMSVRVSVTPHGSPLQGHCPTAGCDTGNHCFEHSVPGGNCHGVTEIKIVYYNP
ncbi:hypothetical protein TRIUR3_24199 [Triticum urartu]|uniref:Uncharacterized protein n=2 Tax=Triticum TaxID=4564 RepID=A0A9R0XR09_TRITD|nr:hypothetical protein TRIUR3_24199 [Triticum urartu]VAI41459.1 unnamed protein product [Triticum turgidum subsp. durum]